jgi:hypothetical protein
LINVWRDHDDGNQVKVLIVKTFLMFTSMTNYALNIGTLKCWQKVGPSIWWSLALVCSLPTIFFVNKHYS